MRSPVTVVTGFRFTLHSGVTYAPHRHRAVEIVLHATGSGTMHGAGQEPVAFSAGDASICPANLVHHQMMRERGTDWCVLLTVRPELMKPIARLHVIRGPLSPTLVQDRRRSDLGNPERRNHGSGYRWISQGLDRTWPRRKRYQAL